MHELGFNKCLAGIVTVAFLMGSVQPAFASPDLEPTGYLFDESGETVVTFNVGYGATRSLRGGETLTIRVENKNPTAQEARVASGASVPTPSGPCFGIATFVTGESTVQLGQVPLDPRDIGIRYSFELVLEPIPEPQGDTQALLKIGVDCLEVSAQRPVTILPSPPKKPLTRWTDKEANTVYSALQRTLEPFSGVATMLTSQQRAQVKSVVDANPDAEKFICTGIRYYSQPMSVNIMLRKRAKAACEFAKQLNPELSTWFQSKPTKARSYAGKVLLTLKNPVIPLPFDYVQVSTTDSFTSSRTPKTLDILRFEVTEPSSYPGTVDFRIYLRSHQHSLNFTNGSATLGLRFDFDGDSIVDGVLSTNEESTGLFGQSFGIYSDMQGGTCRARYEHNPFYPSNLAATPLAKFSLAANCLDTKNYFGIQAFSETIDFDGDLLPESGFQQFQAPWSFGRVN